MSRATSQHTLSGTFPPKRFLVPLLRHSSLAHVAYHSKHTPSQPVGGKKRGVFVVQPQFKMASLTLERLPYRDRAYCIFTAGSHLDGL